MKTLRVKIPVLVILISVFSLTACSSIQGGDTAVILPEAGGTVTGTVVENTDDSTLVTNPEVTGSEVESEAVSETASEAVTEQYVVQLIASANEQKAQSIQREFTGEGYQVYVSPKVVAGQTLHRVQVGPYSTKADAYSMLESMRRRYLSNAYVSGAVVKTINGS